MGLQFEHRVNSKSHVLAPYKGLICEVCIPLGVYKPQTIDR